MAHISESRRTCHSAPIPTVWKPSRDPYMLAERRVVRAEEKARERHAIHTKYGSPEIPTGRSYVEDERATLL